MARSRKAAAIEDQGLGWHSKYGSGIGADAITGGPEVTWTQTPTRWNNDFFDNLFKYEWELRRAPRVPGNGTRKTRKRTIPDAYDPSKKHVPTMLTTDLSLRFDPAYEKISRRFYEHPDEFADAFARAWFKLTHRDMGPIQRYLGPLVPKEALIWQDRVPALDHEVVSDKDIADLKAKILASGLYGTAAGLDGLGVGIDVPWLRQARRRQWRTHPPRATEGLGSQRTGATQDGAGQARSDPEGLQRRADGRQESSLADLIVLGGSAAVEKAAKDAGVDVKVPFTPGRTDASQEQTDAASFAPLEPRADGFRNYISRKHQFMAPEEALVDRAQLLTLTGPETDGSRWRLACPRCQRRRVEARRLHRPAGEVDERLLPQPARHAHAVAAGWRGCLRGPRPQDRRTAVDRRRAWI